MVDGQTITWDRLHASAEAAFGRRWQERIAMDLDAVLDAAGVKAGDTVTLRGRPLDRPDAGVVDPAVELRDVPHTAEKRRAAREHFRDAQRRAMMEDRVPSRPVLEDVARALRDLHAQGMRLGVDGSDAAPPSA